MLELPAQGAVNGRTAEKVPRPLRLKRCFAARQIDFRQADDLEYDTLRCRGRKALTAEETVTNCHLRPKRRYVVW